MARKLKLALYPSLVMAALLVGLCRASLGQGDADLEAPGLAPFHTLGPPCAMYFDPKRFHSRAKFALVSALRVEC
jgi:hypothetical protein